MSLEVDGFRHLHAGHCESGVTASMFINAGMNVSEPMVFGVGSGLFFGHFSFVRIMGHPLTTFRSFPGALFKAACKRPNVACQRETFRDPPRGLARLDELLSEGKRVGLQVNIFWLPYIPRPMRVHFNGHNLLVLEKRGDEYIVSDPVMECLFSCPADALERARFTGANPLLPRGLLYHPTRFPQAPPWEPAVKAGLAEVCFRMRKIPPFVPWLGIRGIRHLGRQVRGWERRLGPERAREWMAGVVRMQEEIGTGGAGFRFLFAAFLQQAGEKLAWPELSAMAAEATAVGDQWRDFALHASRTARGKADRSWAELGDQLDTLADAETRLFDKLDSVRR